MPRYDQKSSVELAPAAVQKALRAELSVPRHQRKQLRVLADIYGFSKSVLGRFSKRLERERIYAYRNERHRRNCRIIAQLPRLGSPGQFDFAISTTYDENGAVLNHSGPTEFIRESDIRGNDVVIGITWVEGVVRNPAALAKPEADKSEPKQNTL